MRQFSCDDELAAVAKDNLWQQDKDGNWRIDPHRDALRMNHTRGHHQTPDYSTVLAAVTKQFHSGEGAIQFAPEAIARSNADLHADPADKKEFLIKYGRFGAGAARQMLELGLWLRPRHLRQGTDHRMDAMG